MLSTLRVEMDFSQGQPYLQAKVNRNSEDLRDRALQNFIERINVSDQTIYAIFMGSTDPDTEIVNIVCSANPPGWAADRRVDNMRSWARQFFQEAEMKTFNEFFDALSAKVSLKLTENPLLPRKR